MAGHRPIIIWHQINQVGQIQARTLPPIHFACRAVIPSLVVQTPVRSRLLLGIQQQLDLLSAKSQLSTAGSVLTEAQLDDIGLNLPTSPSPLPSYSLTYLSAQLSLRNAATNISEWQEVIDYYNDQTAARWYVGNAAASTGSNRASSVGMPPNGLASVVTVADIPTTSLTTAILTAAGMGETPCLRPGQPCLICKGAFDHLV